MYRTKITIQGGAERHPKDAEAAGRCAVDDDLGRRVVMQILGHSQISMTSKYAHVLPLVMKDAADRIGQALWAIRNQLQLELQLATHQDRVTDSYRQVRWWGA
jgi:hypothetical protein